MNQPLDPAVLHAVLNDLAERLEALENANAPVSPTSLRTMIREANERAIANARLLSDQDEQR
ncbi:hypothetical protein ACLBV5_09740 [Brevundimonas sp. M1A4_2e]